MHIFYPRVRWSKVPPAQTPNPTSTQSRAFGMDCFETAHRALWPMGQGQSLSYMRIVIRFENWRVWALRVCFYSPSRLSFAAIADNASHATWCLCSCRKWAFPKIRGTLFGVVIIRILLFQVLYQGPLFWEPPNGPKVQGLQPQPKLKTSVPKQKLVYCRAMIHSVFGFNYSWTLQTAGCGSFKELALHS